MIVTTLKEEQVLQEQEKIYKVEIITRRENFQALKDALSEIGVEGLTVYNVEGCGVQKGITTYYRGMKTEVNLIPKIKIDCIVSEVPYELVMSTAQRVLATSQVGDGKIFVSEIIDAMRIRTGERGKQAINNET